MHIARRVFGILFLASVLQATAGAQRAVELAPQSVRREVALTPAFRIPVGRVLAAVGLLVVVAAWWGRRRAEREDE